MTTSHQFKEVHIMSSTMKRIKLTMTQLNERLFTIECYMPTYEPQKASVCKQQFKMFKNDNFTFYPSDDLMIHQKVLLDHPNSIGAHNKMHKPHFWHVNDQDP
jgi:hypothetical protein